MQINTKRTGGILQASLCGELDHHSAAQVRSALDGALEADVLELQLDMRGITFMDSSGIGVILGRYKILQERGGRLCITAMSTYAARILKMSGVLSLVGKGEIKGGKEDV